MPPQHDSLPAGAPDDSDHFLLAELRSHNAYFDSLVNMIPARLYVAGASGDDAYNHHPRYLKGQHKESKEARRARSKVAKSEKFDPERVETTLEVKRRLKREMEERSDSDGDAADLVMSDGDGEDENEDADDGEADSSVRPPEEVDASSGDGSKAFGTTYTSRIEALRAKLHAKMAERRSAAGIVIVDDGEGAREGAVAAAGARGAPAPAALVSKRAARRAEKRRRQEAAKQRNKKRANSVAETTKRGDQDRVVNLGGSKFNAPDAAKSSAAAIPAADDLATIDYQPIAGLKPKLEGSLDNNKSLGGKKKKKSLERLLADAERKQARLQELKESGTEEDREKAKNLEWGEALKVAGGANLRKTNDPKLLKKALKRKAKKKAASAKAWGARLDQAKEAANKRQDIRAHNLDARKLGGAVGANLSSKRIVERENHDTEGGRGGEGKQKEKRRRLGPHSDQGRNRAGFEGKKSGFINGSGDAKASSGSIGGAKKGKR